MKRILFISVLLVSCFAVKAQVFTSVSPSGHILYYEVTSSSYSHTAQVINKAHYYDQNMGYYMLEDSTVIGNVVIPDTVTYNGVDYSVVKIFYGAFYNHIGITSVSLPATITEIDMASFSNCRNLASITIPSNVISIGSGAFSNCLSLSTITIPTSVTTIGDQAFTGCCNLTSISVQNGNTVYDSRNNCNAIIETNYNKLIYGCANTVVPGTVHEIGSYAFYGITGLLSITLPASVWNVASTAFAGCSGLLSINVLSGNPYYDSRNNCNAIIRTADNRLIVGCKNTIVPSSVTEIGECAFFNCLGLQSIILPESVTSIGRYSFALCENMRTITIPSGVISIGDYALESCDTILMMPITAPQITYCSFDTAVYVSIPCGADESYYDNSHGWQNYQSNIHEPLISGIEITLGENHSNYGNTIILQQRGKDIYCDSTCIISATPNEGYRFMYWSNGNTANPDTLRLTSDSTVTAIFSDVPDPELCMVSVEDGHNRLQWYDAGSCATYKIYREGVVAGEYELLSEIASDEENQYEDSTSRPQTRSYRYRISAVDSDGIEGDLSPIHKTMHLSINQGLGGRWNLSWTPYEGAEYTTYIIYRGTNATDLQQIDIMPADGNTSYSDETAPEGDVFYQVGIVMSTPCSSGPDSTTGTKSTSISRSNIATNSSVDISNVENDGIDVYSQNGQIVVRGTTDRVLVYDMVGRQEENQSLRAGVYLVKIGNHPARKVVVIR